jgi:hypothetical protein
LCTDGANNDFEKNEDEERIYFSKIAEEAQNNSTKIFITRMDNCNLKKFEIISRKTGGCIQEMKSLESTFSPIIEVILKKNLAGTCKFILLSNSNLVHLKVLHNSMEHSGVGRIEIDHLKKNTEKLLIKTTILKKHTLRDRTEPVVFFQVQFLSYDATTQCHQNRIITKALDWINFKKVDIFTNESIIHGLNLKIIAHHLMERDDLKAARDLMTKFNEFKKIKGLSSEEINNLHEVIKNYKVKKNSDDVVEFLSQFLSKYKNRRHKTISSLKPIQIEKNSSSLDSK